MGPFTGREVFIAEAAGTPFGMSHPTKGWFRDFVPQGESAELIAERWDLSREEMDEFAARSHRLAAEAIEAGRFDAELIDGELDGEVRRSDQTVRPGTTVETLAGLRVLAWQRELGPVRAFSGLKFKRRLREVPAQLTLTSYGAMGELRRASGLQIVPAHYSALPRLFALTPAPQRAV